MKRCTRWCPDKPIIASNKSIFENLYEVMSEARAKSHFAAIQLSKKAESLIAGRFAFFALGILNLNKSGLESPIFALKAGENRDHFGVMRLPIRKMQNTVVLPFAAVSERAATSAPRGPVSVGCWMRVDHSEGLQAGMTLPRDRTQIRELSSVNGSCAGVL